MYSIFMVFLLSFVSIISNNYVIWWSVFLLMTIIFIFLNKKVSSYSSLVNYFIIQESLGLMFLLMGYSLLQFFIILMKIGASPLHFWVFSVTNGVFSYNLMWFLTFQKFPFLLILLQLFWVFSFIILFVGLLFCYFQFLTLKNYKNMIIISSTESFNWVVLGLVFSIFNSFFIFIYYIMLMLFLVGKFSKMGFNNLNWETVLVFMNIPFSVTFFVKIFSMSEILKLFNMYLYLSMLFLFLSSLVFMFFFVNISVKKLKVLGNYNSSVFFLLYPLMMLVLI